MLIEENIEITAVALQFVLDHCRRVWPEEGCGFLFGREDGIRRISSFIPIDNVAAEPTRSFTMHPQQMIGALYGRGESTDRDKLKLLGIVHSHPLAPPIPSAHDLRSAWHTLPSQWIVSLANDSEPLVRAYRYADIGGAARQAVPLHIQVIG
ncbi:M67 family metallopeptidase [Paenibacillus filicis]|uniref:M67 family metallopeptidase n=1 Tax=Paenibacillus filicis TaxID=669464 RepID=A0ABU9DE57_9BACL